jgi:hypothetical protein
MPDASKKIEAHGARMIMQAAILNDQESRLPLAFVVMRMRRARRRNQRSPLLPCAALSGSAGFRAGRSAM